MADSVDNSQGCIALCISGICTICTTAIQQTCYYTKCGRSQDAETGNRGCCGSCFDKGFNEDDFDAKQRKDAKRRRSAKAKHGSASGGGMEPTPQMKVTEPSGTAIGGADTVPGGVEVQRAGP